MTRFVKYKTLAGEIAADGTVIKPRDPIYEQIVDQCLEELTSSGVFNIHDLLVATGLGSVAIAIRWDYIVRMIEEDYGGQLFPLAMSYWKRPRGMTAAQHAKDKEVTPGRYVASGNGKRTAGYGLFCDDNGHFIRYVLERKESVRNGVVVEIAKTVNNTQNHAPVTYQHLPKIGAVMAKALPTMG